MINDGDKNPKCGDVIIKDDFKIEVLNVYNLSDIQHVSYCMFKNGFQFQGTVSMSQWKEKIKKLEKIGESFKV